MSNRLMYTCTALAGTNKSGSIKADSDGYYETVLGAVNVYNSQQQFYTAEPVKKILDESSHFMRRVKGGMLHGECGHPKLTPGMTSSDFVRRVMQIYETNISHHIADVWIDDQHVKDDKGNKVIATMGRVKPTGPMKDGLAEAFENKRQNVCFSIRSLTNDILDRTGRYTKNITQIITWDWVMEPGIQVANKFSYPSLEQLQITRQVLEEIIQETEKMGVGFESGGFDAYKLMEEMGWKRLNYDTNKPAYLQW